jgi:transcriptional regulator with XRE-family HTH domain
VEDGLVRERFSDVYGRLIDRIFERAGSPEAVGLELKNMGYLAAEGRPYSPRTMRSWRSRDHRPDPEQLLALAARYEISIDKLLFGQQHEAEAIEQLREQAKKIADLETTQDFLLAWNMRDPEFVAEVRRRDEQRREEAAG